MIRAKDFASSAVKHQDYKPHEILSQLNPSANMEEPTFSKASEEWYTLQSVMD